MTNATAPSDLELAALISSKICHDVVGPVGAIYNGLEILDDDADGDSRSYALDVIRSVTEQASARLQFARFAFGAAGSAGAEIELDTARQISIGFIGEGKHKLIWNGQPGTLPKNRVKLLLNLIAAAVTALPRGGEITLDVSHDGDGLMFHLRCCGRGARAPPYLPDFIADSGAVEIDALSIQAYYTWRLAMESGMALRIDSDGDDILLVATA
jgi:histidine phosphotransferase ChpT